MDVDLDLPASAETVRLQIEPEVGVLCGVGYVCERADDELGASVLRQRVRKTRA